MICFPRCKINLGLNILSKREDGFHNLESIFYPVNWNDSLEVIPAANDAIHVYGNALDINPENNIVWKALQLLRTKFEIPSVAIHLLKSIPSGAGLGGGSANGSYTLSILNELFSLNIKQHELIEFSAQLGSDCPFFIKNSPQLVTGRGEILEDISLDLSKHFIVLIHPNIHISTALAFSKISPSPPISNLKDAIKQPIEAWQGLINNDFEAGVFEEYPVLAELKNELLEKGAIYASMTGTGSTLYGIFKETPTGLNFKNYNFWTGKLSI